MGYMNHDLLKSVTKGLYPQLAQRYGVTVFQVESSIRNSIALAWEEGNQRELKMCLGESYEESELRPTNSEVIERLVGFVSNLKH